MKKQKTVKKYILVVEDEDIYAKLLQKRLTEKGYDVKVVGNGKSAMISLKKRRPDLVLLDLVLPIMDGYELLEKVRKDETLKNLKVMILSNLGQEVEIRRAKNLGVPDFVIKTNISLEGMLEKVRKFIS